jgi:chromosome segregation ATPase
MLTEEILGGVIVLFLGTLITIGIAAAQALRKQQNDLTALQIQLQGLIDKMNDPEYIHNAQHIKKISERVTTVEIQNKGMQTMLDQLTKELQSISRAVDKLSVLVDDLKNTIDKIENKLNNIEEINDKPKRRATTS